MTWFKVDDGFWSHKKVMAIPVEERAAAVGLWVMAAAWCAHQLEDGKFPKYLLPVMAGTEDMAVHLVRVGLWKERKDYYLFHDWSRWQTTRADVEAKREKDAERKRKWREAQAAKDDPVPDMSQRDSARTDAVTPRGVRAPDTEQIQSREDQIRSDVDPSSSYESNARALHVINGEYQPTGSGDA